MAPKIHRHGSSKGSGKAGKGGESNPVDEVPDDCFSLYEWSNYVGELGGYNFTGSNFEDGIIGTFNTPVFYEPTTLGDPIARLRGNYILDTASDIATYTATWYFVEDEDYLAYYLEFSTNVTTNQGVTVGGTGRWAGYEGYISGGEFLPDRSGSSRFVIKYTVCPS